MIQIISVIIFLAVVPAIFYPFVEIFMSIHGSMILIISPWLSSSVVTLFLSFIAIELYVGLSALIKK